MFEKVCQTYAKEKQKELGHQSFIATDHDQSFMIYDAFKAQKTDKVKVLLATNNTNLALVPAGCTIKCHALDVCINNINKPFKGVLRNFWEDYVASIVTNFTETKKQQVRVLSFHRHRDKKQTRLDCWRH